MIINKTKTSKTTADVSKLYFISDGYIKAIVSEITIKTSRNYFLKFPNYFFDLASIKNKVAISAIIEAITALTRKEGYTFLCDGIPLSIT
jgi:hypothetical protein